MFRMPLRKKSMSRFSLSVAALKKRFSIKATKVIVVNTQWESACRVKNFRQRVDIGTICWLSENRNFIHKSRPMKFTYSSLAYAMALCREMILFGQMLTPTKESTKFYCKLNLILSSGNHNWIGKLYNSRRSSTKL